MSTDVYAGHLCATHVNEWITHPELDRQWNWWLAEIRHSERHETVMLVCKGIDFNSIENSKGVWPKTAKVLRLEPDDVVAIAVR